MPWRRPKRVLLFHMGGVLGHLSRVLALAEAIDAAGHEAIVATSDGEQPILRVLRPGVRVVDAWDEPRFKASRSAIASFDKGRRGDRRNVRGMGPQDPRARIDLARMMDRMVRTDRALVERIDPDAVILDYRFTPWPACRDRRDRTFLVSPLLGLPSLHQRATGRLPYPFDQARILVPGIREIEGWRRQPPSLLEADRIAWCGPFRWHGWARLRGQPVPPPAADILFSFGSTGDAGAALRRMTHGWPDARWIGSPGQGASHPREDAVMDLERGLAAAKMLVCHGGHGTVMEALLHACPVIVVPSNPEQLEIGRRIEAMRLGLLVTEPVETLGPAGLARLVDRVRGDALLHRRVGAYAARLRRHADGAARAAAIVLAAAGATLPLSTTAR